MVQMNGTDGYFLVHMGAFLYTKLFSVKYRFSLVYMTRSGWNEFYLVKIGSFLYKFKLSCCNRYFLAGTVTFCVQMGTFLNDWLQLFFLVKKKVRF